MKIRLSKTGEKMIGAVRVSTELHEKLSRISKENKVSLQEVIRAILESIIDEVEV